MIPPTTFPKPLKRELSLLYKLYTWNVSTACFPVSVALSAGLTLVLIGGGSRDKCGLRESEASSFLRFSHIQSFLRNVIQN